MLAEKKKEAASQEVSQIQHKEEENTEAAWST